MCQQEHQYMIHASLDGSTMTSCLRFEPKEKNASELNIASENYAPIIIPWVWSKIIFVA